MICDNDMFYDKHKSQSLHAL